MGSITFGVPKLLIERLQSAFNILTFVETGTFKGETSAWASDHFKKVITIEGSPEFHQAARQRYAHRANIEFLLGDSATRLGAAIEQANPGPVVYWLDAHWMPGAFHAVTECPILQELATIRQASADPFILIDDARLFLAPPPSPHRAADWPDITAVLAALNPTNRPPSYTVVLNDVIISVPESARAQMQTFYQEQVTAALQAEAQAAVPLLARIKQRLRRMIGRA